MSAKLEKWLTTNGETILGTQEISPGLSQRLQFVAALLAETDPLPAAPALVFRDGSGRATAILAEQTCTVGRDEKADLTLNDGKLSRQHFTIQCGADTARIEDLQSRNGTYLNGARITESDLRDGDVIEAGSQVFVFLQAVPPLNRL